MIEIDLIGYEGVNNGGSKFKVLEKTEVKIDNRFMYKVEFETGYIGLFSKKSILNGAIKDKFFPIICGVGFIGNASFKNNKQEYGIWNDIIHRCYDEKHKSYVRYGGRGISVCERWHSFENFLEDLPKVKGYDEERFRNRELELDKDKSGGMIYSLDSCEFLTIKENNKLATEKQKISFVAISPDGEEFAVNGLLEFCRNYNQFSPQAVLYALNKSKSGICKGWKFKYQ